MEKEDSRFALFTEPNAYVQNYNNANCDCKKEKERKKIVFQEPYETLPNFYVNNNFTKHNCVKNNQPCDIFPKPHHDYKCNHDILNNSCGCGNKKDNCNSERQKGDCGSTSKGFVFDIILLRRIFIWHFRTPILYTQLTKKL